MLYDESYEQIMMEESIALRILMGHTG